MTVLEIGSRQSKPGFQPTVSGWILWVNILWNHCFWHLLILSLKLCLDFTHFLNIFFIWPEYFRETISSHQSPTKQYAPPLICLQVLLSNRLLLNNPVQTSSVLLFLRLLVPSAGVSSWYIVFYMNVHCGLHGQQVQQYKHTKKERGRERQWGRDESRLSADANGRKMLCSTEKISRLLTHNRDSLQLSLCIISAHG